MRSLIFLYLTFISLNVHAQANVSLSNLGVTSVNADLHFATIGGYGTRYITTGVGDSMVLQTNASNGNGGGFNVFSGSSVQIQAGGDGPVSLSTSSSFADIDLMSSGSVLLFTGSGIPAYVYAESLQVNTDHGLQLYQTAAKPACDSSYRGTLYYNAAALGVADSLQICMKLANDSYGWHIVP